MLLHEPLVRKTMTTSLKFGLAFIAILLGSSNGSSAADLISLSGRTMGTTYSVKLSSLPEGVTADELQVEIDLALEKVNDQMSTWREDSEISRFNRSRDTDWFPVSKETAYVVQTAIEMSQKTEGAFDVTVGPLVNLWSFGPDKAERKIPPRAVIDKTRSRVGFEFLRVRQFPPALKKTRADLYVDLSAIAKGFGVDQSAELLRARGIDSYMVEIGGEVRTQGTKPDGKAWRVGIETPTPFSRGIRRVLELSGESLATSGDYRNFAVIDGKHYSHTIDPRTGRPVEHGLASVSIVAENCMLADAYATAILVMGPDAGYNWAKDNNIAAFLIVRDGEAFAEKSTAAFSKYLKETPEVSMLTTWLIAAGVFVLAVLLMAVGVILSNRRIAGSCGGLAGMRDSSGRTLCEACTDPAPDCQGPEDAADRSGELAVNEKPEGGTP